MAKPRSAPPTGRTPSGSSVPQARKASQPVPAAAKPAPPRFYDGPTVSAKAEEITEKAKTVAKVTAAEAKIQSKNALRTVRRHPWGFISLFSTIPFLISMSLFSSVLCRPPNAVSSPIDRYLLSPIGIHTFPAERSALLETFCYPSDVYREGFLEPYVFPVLDLGQQRLLNHPVYKHGLEPGYAIAKDTSTRLWEGPLRPVADRITLGARRVYLTFIEPHLPYLKARFNAITVPYTSRISTFHRSQISPRIATAGSYARTASDRSVETYNYVSTHPVTATTTKYGNAGLQVVRRRANDVYAWSRPHLVRAGQQAEVIAREVLGPRAVAALEWGADQAGSGWAVLKVQVSRLYYTHVDPYVGPQLSKVSVALSPYVSTFNAKVYNPYIRPVIEAYLPVIAFTPEPPKTFWSMIADKLPNVGSHVAETKGSMGDFYADVNRASRPADVPLPSGVRGTNSKSANRAELEAIREGIRERVEKQGQKGYKKVHDELVKLYSGIISSDQQMGSLAKIAREEMDREVDYILKGLDKLFTSSTSLTRDQVKQSGELAEDRLSKKVEKIMERVDKKRLQWIDQGKPIVDQASRDVDDALGTEWTQLRASVGSLRDVTQKDHQRLDAIKKTADEWKAKYSALQKGETRDRQLNAASANIPKAVNNLKLEMDGVSETFRDRIGILKRTAYDRIDAREAIGTSSRSSSYSSSSTTTGSGRASILPIPDMGAAVGVAGAIIGKGKDQVLDALSQASTAAGGETASLGVMDQARSVASSAYDAASSSVHDATRSVISAVGGTPSPESPREHAESIINLASEQAGSAYDAAGSAVHQATQTVKSVVSASASPGSLGEQAESLVRVASSSAESAISVASDAIHQGTRTALAAVGATPSPESLAEHAESIANIASASAASLASVAGDLLHQGTRSIASVVGATPSPESAQAYLESIANNVAQGYASVTGVIGDNLHDATRSAISAVGATPSPESLGEHAESLVSVASSSAKLVASAASSVLHDGTRSVMKAVGATPIPESPGEYAESVASVASASASSVSSAASSVLRDATRSAMKAVGATPSPETPMEHAESVYDAASSTVSSVGDVIASSGAAIVDAATASASSAYAAVGSASASVTDQAVLLASQIQSALGLVPTPSPAASTASAYLASLASAGSSAGSDLLASGSSLLISLQSEASTTLHSATRAASRAVGATPTPETLGEYVESVQDRVLDASSSAESLIREQATAVVSGAAEVTQSLKSMVGRDEL